MQPHSLLQLNTRCNVTRVPEGSTHLAAILAMMLMLTGCSKQGPSAPPPPGGYRYEQISTQPPAHLHVPTLHLPETRLSESNPPPVPQELLPRLTRRQFFVIEGTLIHPDARMTSGNVLARLLVDGANVVGRPPNAERVLVNEATAIAEGNAGKLVFRLEVKIPDRAPRTVKLELTFHGSRPGVQKGDDAKLWIVPIAETTLEVTDN